jgi:hypothetical protein
VLQQNALAFGGARHGGGRGGWSFEARAGGTKKKKGSEGSEADKTKKKQKKRS